MNRSSTLFFVIIFLTSWVVFYFVIPIPRFYTGPEPSTATSNIMNGLAVDLWRVINENDDHSANLIKLKQRWDSIDISERVDGWNNDFQLILLAEGSSAPEFFRLYSYGADGISRTEGNDKDDLNSWNKEVHLDYYSVRTRAEYSRLVFKQRIFQSLVFSAVVAVCLTIYFGFRSKDMHRPLVDDTEKGSLGKGRT